MHNNVLALVTLYFLTETSCLSDMSRTSSQLLSMLMMTTANGLLQ